MLKKQMNQKINELAKLEDLLIHEEKTRMEAEQSLINVFDSRLASTEDRMKRYINEEVSRMALELARKDEESASNTEKVMTYVDRDLNKFAQQMKSHERMQENKMLQSSKNAENERGKQVDNISQELQERIELQMQEKDETLKQSARLEAENTKDQLREEMKIISSQFDRRINELAASHVAMANKPPTEVNVKHEKQEKEESQVDVDSVIKKEVRKQLAKIKYAKDVRSKNLRKIVAQKKMKKLLHSFLNNDDLEDVDF